MQPVAEVAAVCREAGVPLLVDAAQSLGWGPVEGEWSLLTASAHKWGGPSGVGLLAVARVSDSHPRDPRDERESGRAPGIENLPAIVAAAASLRAVRAEAAARGRTTAGADGTDPGTGAAAGSGRGRGRGIPSCGCRGIVTFSCLYVDGETLLHELDRAGFSVSSGSSCTSSTLTPSHVLKAMGVLSEGNVRVSLPWGATSEEVDRFLEVLPGAVAEVREKLGAPTPSTAPRTGERLAGRGRPRQALPDPGDRAGEGHRRGTGGREDQGPVGRRGGTAGHPGVVRDAGQEYVGEERADKGTAYLIRRLS